MSLSANPCSVYSKGSPNAFNYVFCGPNVHAMVALVSSQNMKLSSTESYLRASACKANALPLNHAPPPFCESLMGLVNLTGSPNTKTVLSNESAYED